MQALQTIGVLSRASPWFGFEVLAPPGFWRNPRWADLEHGGISLFSSLLCPALSHARRPAQEPGCLLGGQKGQHTATITQSAPPDGCNRAWAQACALACHTAVLCATMGSGTTRTLLSRSETNRSCATTTATTSPACATGATGRESAPSSRSQGVIKVAQVMREMSPQSSAITASCQCKPISTTSAYSIRTSIKR
jgi:hypothetical protein